MPIEYNKGERPPGSAPSVSLGKTTLTKSAPQVSLSKPVGELRVNLNWSSRPAGGFFKSLRGSGPIDLDLGCLYELADGKKGVVQALGNSFQSKNGGAPIIALDGDDRSGENAAGENLRIDLSRRAELRRVLVFAYIYEGAPSWARADAVVTLYSGSEVIEVRLDEADPKAQTCAVALLESTPDGLRIQREVRYIHGAQRRLDEAYGWGMRWTAGRK